MTQGRQTANEIGWVPHPQQLGTYYRKLAVCDESTGSGGLQIMYMHVDINEMFGQLVTPHANLLYSMPGCHRWLDSIDSFDLLYSVQVQR